MKKRILFVNDEMVMGGVARILNNLLSVIDKDKYIIDLLILHKRGELLKEIPEGINIIEGTSFFKTVDIPLKNCRLNNIFSKICLLFYMKTGLIKKKIKKERQKLLKYQYDIEFSAKEGFCTIFTAYGDSKKKFNWIQVDYKQNNYSSNHMRLLKEALKHIDMNIACSNNVLESYKELFEVDRIMVIHNLMNNEKIKKLANEKCDLSYSEDKINLICVARFHFQKGLDRLIEAYSYVKDYYTLTIIGDGTLKDELYTLAKNLKVFDKINWLGLKDNPYSFIKQADLFVLPSLYEGYPTITLEALLSSTPFLALEVAGVKEQLEKEYYGWVIENSLSALKNKLEKLKDSKSLLLEYKEKLKTYNYDNQSILDAYYRLFDE